MRILVVSFPFAPYNTIGAVRVTRMAEQLAANHDIRVLSAAPQLAEATLGTTFPESRVRRSRWWDVNRPVSLLLGGRNKVARSGYQVAGGKRSMLGRFGKLYKTMFNFPDSRVGWILFGHASGSQLLRHWTPDVIYASALPISSLLIAKRLAKRSGAPWVAEFRDLWLDSPLYNEPPLRRFADSIIEKRILESADGLVTVSEPLAVKLRAKTSRPVATVLNGFDAYPASAERRMAPRNILRIVYCGMIYEGQRDPRPLFRAIGILPATTRYSVRLAFYGRYLDGVRRMAAEEGVGESVEVHPPVPHADSLRIQRDADLLLLMIWDSPAADTDYTGKFFEYVGARQPILALCRPTNVAAQVIQRRNLGFVSLDPELIAAQLKSWIQLKADRGHLPPTPQADDLSRQSQTRRLERFLDEVVNHSRLNQPGRA